MTTPSCTYDPPAWRANQYPYNPIRSIGSGNVAVRFKYTGSNSWMSDEPTLIYLDASMQTPLDSFANNLSYFSSNYGSQGYGALDWVGHVGGPPGEDRHGSYRETYHNVGKALDITVLHWKGGLESRPRRATTEARNVTTLRRMIGVEAGLRKWFGYVLNRKIDDHDDHIHVDTADHADDSCPVALRLRRRTDIPAGDAVRGYTSSAYFIQDCINAFTGADIAHDGD